MEPFKVIKESQLQGGYKVIKKQNYIETINKLNQLIHYIDLSYIQAGIIYQGWIGFRTPLQMKEILSGHFLEIFKTYKCKYLLTDCSRMKGNFTEINDWYAGTFMEELIQSGLLANVTIYPNETFALMSVKEWNTKIKDVKNASFQTHSEALNWLALI
jgi:hypothetical protein